MYSYFAVKVNSSTEILSVGYPNDYLNSETLAIYFQELNYNIIKYCEKKYPVQSKYSLDFESKTETSNKGKQKVKQHAKTTPNTPILPKTTAKHLQTPEQETSVKLPLSITPFLILLARPQTPNSLLNCFSRPEDFQSPRNPTQQQKLISTNTNIIEYLQKNESDHSVNLESKETESEQEEATKNEKEMTTAYIAKIPEFTAGLKDKPIKKVCQHAPTDLTTAIRHAKNYEMAMEEVNYTKLVNLAIGETSSTAEKKIDQLTKKESNFQQPALSKGKVAASRSNFSNNTIPPAQIAQNANFSDIFPFEFEANESLFLLNSGSAGSIITYQLIQQLQRTVDRLVQTVIVTADGMKKTPVGEIDNFLFTIDGITISVKVLVIDAPQYQALVGNDWLLKANANLDWETQELKISYQGQYTIVPATCDTFNKQSKKAPVFEFEEEKEMPLTETYMALGSTSNWAKETEQEIFEESRGWKKVRYSTSEP
ncbi:hypothetical protein G9A89_003285 [Geosiphon pyriformis]|nr:hypothetical protein G9A89_003285 [Geosiphon pyriformis]